LRDQVRQPRTTAQPGSRYTQDRVARAASSWEHFVPARPPSPSAVGQQSTWAIFVAKTWLPVDWEDKAAFGRTSRLRPNETACSYAGRGGTGKGPPGLGGFQPEKDRKQALKSRWGLCRSSRSSKDNPVGTRRPGWTHTGSAGRFATGGVRATGGIVDGISPQTLPDTETPGGSREDLGARFVGRSDARGDHPDRLRGASKEERQSPPNVNRLLVSVGPQDPRSGGGRNDQGGKAGRARGGPRLERGGDVMVKSHSRPVNERLRVR